MLKTFYIYRSAITGRFVTRAYAEAHPETTMKVARIIEVKDRVRFTS